MLNPWFELLATRPQWLATQASAWAHLLAAEGSAALASWRQRLVLQLVAALAATLGLGLAAVSLMLWAVSPAAAAVPPHTIWLLVLLPLLPLALAAGCMWAVRRSTLGDAQPRMARLAQQWQADVQGLQQALGREHAAPQSHAQADATATAASSAPPDQPHGPTPDGRAGAATRPLAQLLLATARTWWARHPLHTTGTLALQAANAAARPTAQRHPVALLLVAAACGGALAWARPWRRVNPGWLGALLLPGLLPSLLPRWVPGLLSALGPATAGTAPPPWLPQLLQALLAVSQPANPQSPQTPPDRPPQTPLHTPPKTPPKRRHKARHTNRQAPRRAHQRSRLLGPQAAVPWALQPTRPVTRCSHRCSQQVHCQGSRLFSGPCPAAPPPSLPCPSTPGVFA